MNRSKKIVGSVFIALLIVCLILSVVGIGYYTDGFTNFVKDSAAPVDVVPAAAEANNLNVVIDEDHNREVIQSGEGVVIQSANLASAPQNAEGDNYIRKTLVATVYPEDAADKTVLWSISWGANPKEEAVSDFVYIEESDSNNIITVVCKQNFGDSSVVIHCQTLVGGWTATCICLFKGAPEDLVVSYNGENVNSGSSLDLVSGTYLFDLDLTNSFGSVGSDYQNPDYSINVYAYGRWSMNVESSVDGGPFEMSSDIYDITFDSTSEAIIYDYFMPGLVEVDPDYEDEFTAKWGTERTGDVSLSISNFVQCSIVDNKLRVNVLSDPTSFIISDHFITNPGSFLSDTLISRLTFKEYKAIGHGSVDPLSVAISIRDNISGEGFVFYVIPQPGGTTGLSVSSNELIF